MRTLAPTSPICCAFSGWNHDTWHRAKPHCPSWCESSLQATIHWPTRTSSLGRPARRSPAPARTPKCLPLLALPISRSPC